jgi:hypothetical protein
MIWSFLSFLSVQRAACLYTSPGSYAKRHASDALMSTLVLSVGREVNRKYLILRTEILSRIKQELPLELTEPKQLRHRNELKVIQ